MSVVCGSRGEGERGKEGGEGGREREERIALSLLLPYASFSLSPLFFVVGVRSQGIVHIKETITIH